MAEKRYIVLGAGVIGLSTAIELKDKCPTAKVRIIAKHFPGDRDADYCSPWAGANWLSIANETQPLHKWEKETYHRFTRIASQSKAAGVQKMDINAFYDNKPEEAGIYAPGATKLWYDELVGGVRMIAMEDLPKGTSFGYTASSFVINTQAYLAWLNTQCLEKDIIMQRKSIDSIYTLIKAFPADAYFNCTGLGSYSLKGVEDKALYPIKGQTLLVETPIQALTRMYFRSPRRVDSDTTYVFPRNPYGGIVLGGCRVDNSWDTTADLELAEDIKRRCCALAPELGRPEDLKVLSHGVGLRPGRKGGPRLEAQHINNSLIVHNYGASGAGYQASWGMAQEAVRLMLENQKATRSKL